MALPVTIPNEFANATASIPLSQLDTNFTTLANAVNGISDGSETLANVTATVANITTANVGALNTSGQVVFNDAGADVDFRVEGDTDANLLFVDASTDRVGIGTNSPQRPLHISAAIPAIRIEDLDTNAYAEVVSNNAGDLLLRADQGNTEANSAMQFEVDGTERMRIDNSGNVGIGTSSPAYTFDVTGRIHNYTTASSTGTVLEKDRAMTSVSGNVAFASFPHALFLYNADTTTDTNIVTLGFGVNTSGAQSNAVIAGESTAAGDMDLAFYTESSNVIGERMRILSSGGITFNGDTAAANALDDYEEGTFTPTIYGLTTAGTPTYNVQLGKYTKIGNVVIFNLLINLSNTGGMAGSLRIANLPFTDIADNINAAVSIGNMGGMAITAGQTLMGRVVNNSDQISLFLTDATTGNTNLQATEILNTLSIDVAGSYFVS